MSEVQIYPAILTGSPELAAEQFAQIGEFEDLKVVHIDIIDGIFADEVTITPVDVAELVPDGLELDFHLMTDEPLDYVYECIEHKENLPIRAVIGQVERMSFQTDFLQDVKSNGWLAGLALDLYTPLESIEEVSWSKLDVIQLMGIEAGAQGEVLNPQVMFKIEELRQELDRRNITLEIIVDGGVKAENIAALRQAGTTSLVAGSALWTTADVLSPAQALDALLAAAGTV